MVVVSAILGIIAAGVLTAEEARESDSKKTDSVTLDDDSKKPERLSAEVGNEKTLEQALSGDFYVQMKNSLRNVLDDFSTVLVMLFLILGSLFTVCVVSFQVHSEVVHLTRLGLVDKLYQMWEDRDKAGLSTSSVAGSVSEKDWMGHLKGLTSISTLKQEAVELVKANVDTIMSIVFLTALYYLLASSHDIWLPIKWISDAVPRSFATTSVSGSSPEKPSKALDITTAIENAIRGVFVLSAKMSVFYGFYTYFIHALFDINVVFIPSMLAAIFAAIPIMAPHVVCIFGFLELYFAERETAAAILFVLASFAPKMFADAAFYRELRGSHPYVTGLAIIGGMYWLGLQ
ncbi:unnamed protein product, partial [Gongylonema pulchrum]|uniref:Transmembrane protein n=1 Tax=Gongylonema pulchrum TaxID=637853 RepID=A0A183DUK8_9BILA